MSIIESDPGAFSFYYSALQFCSNIPEGLIQFGQQLRPGAYNGLTSCFRTYVPPGRENKDSTRKRLKWKCFSENWLAAHETPGNNFHDSLGTYRGQIHSAKNFQIKNITQISTTSPRFGNI